MAPRGHPVSGEHPQRPRRSGGGTHTPRVRVARRRQTRRGGHTPTKPPTAEPVAASGTLNPLCRVLCTLRSVYLCAIGPAPVISLTMDTPRTSSGSPKQLYSREPGGPGGGERRAPYFTGLSPSRAGSRSRALERHGAPTQTGGPLWPGSGLAFHAEGTAGPGPVTACLRTGLGGAGSLAVTGAFAVAFSSSAE